LKPNLILGVGNVFQVVLFWFPIPYIRRGRLVVGRHVALVRVHIDDARGGDIKLDFRLQRWYLWFEYRREKVPKEEVVHV
jgi:hypothetical protein